jgi:vacuolar-type H+-ATPase subunit I/STV1
MFDTAALLTLTLAKVYGLYMIVAGMTGLVDAARWRAIMDDFQRSPGLAYITGVIVFVLGLVLVTIHNFWGDPLAMLISLFGWIALIEGILLLAVPNGLMKLGAALVATPGRSRAFALFAVILGAVLLAAGFLGRASLSI